MRSHSLKLDSAARVLAALVLVAVFAVSIPLVRTASAMPNFARKYDVGCATCHNVIPRLNEFGYKFRAAGYRMPDEIGKTPAAFNLGDYIAGRVQGNFGYSATTPPTGASTHLTQLQFTEFTLYPITGALTSNLSSMAELSLAPEDVIEIENAYVRYTTGDENSFFSARAGIFHPFEGYGASDRPMALTRPYFQGTTATNGTGAAKDGKYSTYFTPWNFDEMGAEVGYTYNRSSIRATVFNGIYYSSDEKKAFPATGGNLVKPAGSASLGDVDFQVFANQILTEDGGGISGYFYHGQLDLPNGDTGKYSANYQNTFNRYAIYASYPIQKALLLGGYESGADVLYDLTQHATNGNFTSTGWFAEADYAAMDLLGLGVRYDYFDPTTRVSDNEISGITGFVNYGFGDGLQLIGEYKSLGTKMTGGTKTVNSVNLRFIWIK